MGAHVVLDRSTLRQYIQHSHAAVQVEFLTGLSMWTAPGGSDRQDYFRVRIIEQLAGPELPEVIEFFPHAEGVPRFRRGDRALVFLEATAERPEFALVADRFPYYTVQGPGEEWILSQGEAPAILSAVRAHTGVKNEKTQGAEALRTALLAQLDSGILRLQDDALSELVRARGAKGFFPTAREVAPFIAQIDSPTLSLARRLALMRLLENTPGFEPTVHWRAVLAKAASAEDATRIIQMASGVDQPGVSDWLADQLRSQDVERRRAAARALRQPWHGREVEALSAALNDPDPRVTRAAIQSLGAIADAPARSSLRDFASAASGNPRRWAEAELRRMEERRSSSSAERAAEVGVGEKSSP